MAEVITVIRDIAIILMALAGLVFFVILALLAFFAFKFFMQVKQQVPTVLGTVQSTAQSVKGTTDFAAEVAITPLIRIAALIAAVSRFFAVLFGGERSRVR